MTSDDADAALMLRVRNGDTAAFSKLVDRHQRAVIRIIYRAIGDSWEAEDLAQRVFVQVYRSARRYQPTALFTTWLFTIVHNTIRNEFRRRSRRREESLEAFQESTHRAEPPRNPLASPATGNPAQIVIARELQDQIQLAIHELPLEQRTAVILSRFEELSHEEIAKVLGCSVPAVKSLLHRARVTLREKLNRYL